MTKEWVDKYGNAVAEIPVECVQACSGPGPADESVAFWQQKLGFLMPRELAIAYLQEFGAWEDLEQSSDEELSQRVLWLACGEVKEDGYWLGLMR